jgi:hypothetical protein
MSKKINSIRAARSSRVFASPAGKVQACWHHDDVVDSNVELFEAQQVLQGYYCSGSDEPTMGTVISPFCALCMHGHVRSTDSEHRYSSVSTFNHQVPPGHPPAAALTAD